MAVFVGWGVGDEYLVGKCVSKSPPVGGSAVLSDSIHRGFHILLFLMPAGLSARPVRANCENIPAGKSFWVRLLDPVASYSSKPGTFIRAVLIQSPDCDGAPVFPAGLEVDGRVLSARKVGLGLVHETASLEIQFDRIVTADGSVLPIASQVVEVDNARERVRNGKIRGILATNTPQGRITSGLIHLPTFNPYSDTGLIIYRLFTVLPEPEIYLPPGTDLRLQLNVSLYVGDQPELPRPSFQMDEYERGDVEMLLKRRSHYAHHHQQGQRRRRGQRSFRRFPRGDGFRLSRRGLAEQRTTTPPRSVLARVPAPS